MKRWMCIFLLMILLLSGCASREPVLVDVDVTGAEAALNEHLENMIAEFRTEFGVEDAELITTRCKVEALDYYSDQTTPPEILVSVDYEIYAPSFTEDLVARAESRTLAWRDVELGAAMTDFLKQKMLALSFENYELDSRYGLFCGFRTVGGELLTFNIYGDYDDGYAEIFRSFDFQEDGTYNNDTMFYCNPTLEADYYSAAEYMENARPASVDGACRCCGGSGKVKQYATNYWWDEGYYADCAACD